MLVFRAGLVVAWVGIVVVTVNAVSALGLVGGRVFFPDFSQAWRAQINGDFGLHLLLVVGWIVYRERRLGRGLLLGVPALLGSVYTLPYIFVATFRANGRFDVLLLGDRVGAAGGSVIRRR